MSIPTPANPSAQPADLPRFASVDTPNGPSGQSNRAQPSPSKMDVGWNIGERPAREYMNWLHWVVYEWFVFLQSWIAYLTNALPPVADNWAIDPATTTGLTFGYKAGYVRIVTDPGSNSVEGTAAGTVALTNNATNIVFYNGTANAIQVTTSYVDAQDKIPLFSIVTLSGAIVWASSLDLRTPHNLFIPRTFTGGNSTGYVPNATTTSKRYLKDDGTFTRPTPDAQSATNSDYTFATTDAWQVVTHTGAAAQNWTVPTNASQPFKAGDVIWISNGAGAGDITILAAGGVTISYLGDAGAGPWVVKGLGNLALLVKVGTDAWQFMVIPPAASAVSTVYAGYVGSDGSTGNSLPSGWSVNKTGTGVYEITHSLGLGGPTLLSVTFSVYNALNKLVHYNRAAAGTATGNKFIVDITDIAESTAADAAFTFIAKRNA